MPISHLLLPLTLTQGINFAEFTLHLFLGVILAMVAAYGLLSLIYYVSWIRVKNKEPPHVAELKREVAIWERTAQRLNVVSLEERAVRDALLAKAMDVRNQLSQEVNVTVDTSKDMWQKNLSELESKYSITDRVLLVKSTVVLVIVILMFFLSHIIPSVEIGLGEDLIIWIAREP
jgi:Na+/H+ antiporter NhaD/arsenite permease-like protein